MTCSKAKSMKALRTANRYRQCRAQLKHDIAAGMVSPLEILQSPPAYLENMTVRELLMAVPNIGPKYADKALHRSFIRSDKTVGDLTERQMWVLDERLSTLNAWCQSLSTA